MRNARFSLPDTVRQPVKAAFATAPTLKPNNNHGCSAMTASAISLSIRPKGARADQLRARFGLVMKPSILTRHSKARGP